MDEPKLCWICAHAYDRQNSNKCKGQLVNGQCHSFQSIDMKLDEMSRAVIAPKRGTGRLNDHNSINSQTH